jgi:site-specific recombinase XerD
MPSDECQAARDTPADTTPGDRLGRWRNRMTDRTLGEAMNEYLEHLRDRGKSERTLYTYRKDAEQITAFFGADRKLSGVLTPHVGKFLKSDALLRLPNRKERAEPTVRKTVRVLRMFLVWARDCGYIERVPLPKDVPMGRDAEAGPGAVASEG